jgi:hypothetical protein
MCVTYMRGDYKEDGAGVDNGMVREIRITEEGKKNLASKRPLLPRTRLLASLGLAWTFLFLPQFGWSADELNWAGVTMPRVSQPGMSQLDPGNELRDNKKGDLRVSVQNLDDVMKVMTSAVPERLEANVQPVTAAQSEKYGLRPNQGVVIIWLDPKGPLGRAGLATSDIILQIDSQPVESLENFIRQVNSLGTLQPATFSVFEHRTGRVRNVRIVVTTGRQVREARGNFLTRQVGAAVAAIQKTARSVQSQVGYASDAGKEAITSAILRLKKLVGLTEEAPVTSFRKGEEFRAMPTRPIEKQAGVPE